MNNVEFAGKQLGSNVALLASESLTSKENYLVNWISSSGLALTDGAFERPGFLVINGAASGEKADVRPWVEGGQYRVWVSAAVASGALLQLDTSNEGQLVTQTSGPQVAIALEASSGAGIIMVQAATAIRGDGAAVPMTTPGTLNVTGTLTAALIATGYVTSTTAAAVTGTTDTATALNTAFPNVGIGQALEFTIFNSGATNAFTLAGGTGVTIAGGATIAATVARSFRLLKTGASTYTAYPR